MAIPFCLPSDDVTLQQYKNIHQLLLDLTLILRTLSSSSREGNNSAECDDANDVNISTPTSTSPSTHAMDLVSGCSDDHQSQNLFSTATNFPFPLSPPCSQPGSPSPFCAMAPGSSGSKFILPDIISDTARQLQLPDDNTYTTKQDQKLVKSFNTSSLHEDKCSNIDLHTPSSPTTSSCSPLKIQRPPLKRKHNGNEYVESDDGNDIEQNLRSVNEAVCENLYCRRKQRRQRKCRKLGNVSKTSSCFLGEELATPLVSSSNDVQVGKSCSCQIQNDCSHCHKQCNSNTCYDDINSISSPSGSSPLEYQSSVSATTTKHQTKLTYNEERGYKCGQSQCCHHTSCVTTYDDYQPFNPILHSMQIGEELRKVIQCCKCSPKMQQMEGDVFHQESPPFVMSQFGKTMVAATLLVTGWNLLKQA